jgi:exopolysaccharide biosynthesis polyprenyl glycosylphosphotransferase
MIKPLRKVHSFYIFVDLILIFIGFYLSYFFRYNSLGDILAGASLPNLMEYSFIFVLWAFFLVFSLKIKNLYYTDRSLTIPREIGRVCISVLYTSILIGAVVFFSQYKFFSRQIFLESIVLLCVFLSGWRTIKRSILRKMISRGFHNTNVTIIGAGRMGTLVLQEIRKMPWWGFKIVGFLDDNVKGEIKGVPVLGTIQDFSGVIKKHFVDEVIITIPSEASAVNQLIKDAKNHRVGVRVVPQSFEEPLAISEMNYLGIVPLLTYKSRKQHPTEFFLKRLFDMALSLISLAALLPVFVLIAVLIKLDSRGPVFYIQKRVGYKGNIFNFYKFRSMITGADKLKNELMEENEVKGGIIFKIRKDPRVTRIGAFLRKYSLDEFPQLLNVLKGDMSLVGPRPPTADEVQQYDSSHMQRISIRPGMTGLSQVRGRSDLSFRKWVKWDEWYINNWSFGLDMMILWWTLPAVLKGKGAY